MKKVTPSLVLLKERPLSLYSFQKKCNYSEYLIRFLVINEISNTYNIKICIFSVLCPTWSKAVLLIFFIQVRPKVMRTDFTLIKRWLLVTHEHSHFLVWVVASTIWLLRGIYKHITCVHSQSHLMHNRSASPIPVPLTKAALALCLTPTPS